MDIFVHHIHERFTCTLISLYKAQDISDYKNSAFTHHVVVFSLTAGLNPLKGLREVLNYTGNTRDEILLCAFESHNGSKIIHHGSNRTVEG